MRGAPQPDTLYMDPANARHRLRAFRPTDLTSDQWELTEARKVLLETMSRLRFRHERDLTRITGRMARLLRRAEAEGVPLDLEVVLHPDFVEHFLQEIRDVQVATFRTDYRRVALELTKTTPWKPWERTGRDRAPSDLTPYSPEEVETFWELARSQSTPKRRRTACWMLVLAHGAGLGPNEVVWAQVKDLHRTTHGPAISVGPPMARTVPFRYRYQDLLDELLVGLEPDDYFTGRDPHTYTSTALSYVLDDAKTPLSNIPRLRLPRLRLTWAIELAQEGVSIADLHQHGGVRLRALAPLMSALPPRPADQVQLVLKGAPPA